MFFGLLSGRIMSDNIQVARQQACADLLCEDEKYILDIYSCVQPERRGRNVSRKQVFLFITRAEENSRSAFLQVFITEKYRVGNSNCTFCKRNRKRMTKETCINYCAVFCRLAPLPKFLQFPRFLSPYSILPILL